MFYMGLDLGQRRDPSAIAVVERMDLARAYSGSVFHSLRVRHLERVPLGTPYPGVVARVREITRNCLFAGGRCALAVDGTGVGAPVVDMLRAARLGCDISPVTITAGDQQHRNGTAWSVPKRDLIAVVQVLLERNELKLARGLRELGALVRELTDMRSIQRPGGRVRLGADGCGEHDDLVIALALACWRARRGQIGFVMQRLPGI
ncbi:MAG: hypothetical protein ABSG41_08330 [Bryobacteraceae bacterium]|jgi:hypothetical protein